MSTDSESHEENELLDAILADSTWSEASERSKQEALREMQRGKWRARAHTLLRCAAVFAVLAASVGTMLINGGRSTSGGHIAQQETGSAILQETEIGDDELLAMLPAGSAVVAQVNGETVLVFLDPQVEAQFVP